MKITDATDLEAAAQFNLQKWAEESLTNPAAVDIALILLQTLADEFVIPIKQPMNADVVVNFRLSKKI